MCLCIIDGGHYLESQQGAKRGVKFLLEFVASGARDMYEVAVVKTVGGTRSLARYGGVQLPALHRRWVA